MATVEQAMLVISEGDRNRILLEAAHQCPKIQNSIFERAQHACARLYNRDWKAEAKEAANWTLDLYATSEFLQAEQAADDIMVSITRDLRCALPFLPSVFVVDAALQVLEILIDDEDTKTKYIDALFEVIDDGFEKGCLGTMYESFRTRLGLVDRKRRFNTDEEIETQDEDEFDDKYSDDSKDE